MNFQTVLSADPLAAAEACGEQMLRVLGEAVAERASANMAISGGTTPKLLFRYLAQAEFDWSKLHLFWVDERAVPPGDPQSNYTLAYDHWLSAVDYPASNIHRIQAELPVSEAAERYADEIRSHFALDKNSFPKFDIIQQGMGPDVHTASLFPGEPLILDRAGIAAAVYVEKLRAARITLLPGALARARQTMMLVTGADKAPALKTVWSGEESLLAAPAQLTRHHEGHVTWFLDEAAAAGIR
ncbi:MAG: 6-phosphogluconolactonase [Acidobacteria bacterium]|nr:6-phosphogluconolactonase [Acidobacteriota bacterium]